MSSGQRVQGKFREKSQTVQVKQSFASSGKELDFILNILYTGLRSFHIVKIIFYPDCNGNPLKGKTLLDWKRKTLTT